MSERAEKTSAGLFGAVGGIGVLGSLGGMIGNIVELQKRKEAKEQSLDLQRAREDRDYTAHAEQEQMSMKNLDNQYHKRVGQVRSDVAGAGMLVGYGTGRTLEAEQATLYSRALQPVQNEIERASLTHNENLKTISTEYSNVASETALQAASAGLEGISDASSSGLNALQAYQMGNFNESKEGYQTPEGLGGAPLARSSEVSANTGNMASEIGAETSGVMEGVELGTEVAEELPMLI